MPADGADRPVTHVRSTKRPQPPRWTVLLKWTGDDGRKHIDPIWTSKAWTKDVVTREDALEVAVNATDLDPADLIIRGIGE